VWQFRQNSESCWVGFGIHCESHSSLLEDPVVAQRLLHGTVYVVRELVGVKVRNLFQLEADASGVSALRIEQCKAWCYSNIACQYWQFSQTEGCLVDAPMLSKTFVPYPLTTAGLSSGTSEAHNIIAGEYIHHYCPNRTTADVDDDAFTAGRSRPANLVPQKEFDGTPRGWPWVVLSLLLTLVLAMAGFAYYALIWRRRGARRRAMREEATPQASPAGNFLPVQVARVQGPSPLPTSGYATPYRTPGASPGQVTPQRNQIFSPFGQGYSPVAPSPFNLR